MLDVGLVWIGVQSQELIHDANCYHEQKMQKVVHHRTPNEIQRIQGLENTSYKLWWSVQISHVHVQWYMYWQRNCQTKHSQM